MALSCCHKPIISCRRQLREAQGRRGSRVDNVAAGMIRLAFHDAVTFAGATANSAEPGGPDGCIDLSEPDNAGLEATVDLLACVHANSAAGRFGPAFSRADVWALAATVAVILSTSPKVASNTVVFRSGRKDTADCSAADAGRYPDAEGGLDSVLALFQSRLGFTQRELVALMGAHSIGRAQLDTSGYVHHTARRPAPPPTSHLALAWCSVGGLRVAVTRARGSTIAEVLTGRGTSRRWSTGRGPEG
jgi:catalase (peroxidase I)